MIGLHAPWRNYFFSAHDRKYLPLPVGSVFKLKESVSMILPTVEIRK